MRQVLLLEPRPVVAHGQLTGGQPDLDDAARRAPLARVVEQVRHGARNPLGPPGHQRRLGQHVVGDLDAGAPQRALDQRPHDHVEAHVVGLFLRLGATRELDDVGDERGQLVQLVHDVVAQGFALDGRQAVGVL